MFFQFIYIYVYMRFVFIYIYIYIYMYMRFVFWLEDWGQTNKTIRHLTILLKKESKMKPSLPMHTT